MDFLSSWTFFIILWLFLDSIMLEAKRITIFDTIRESTLKWITNSANSEEGWIEESVTDLLSGINARSYVTCEVEKEHVDNWVRTPFIEKGVANRLSLELKFTIRDCMLYPRVARTCKETFTLYAFETDVDFAGKYEPPWSDKNYKRIDRLAAAQGRFSDRNNAQVNVEVRSIPVTKKGVYFAFRDEGACVSLLGVKVFYDVCEKTAANLALFSETPTGPNVTSIQPAEGRCVENSTPVNSLPVKNFCKSDGNWDLLSGACHCDKGYKTEGQKCTACDIGTFKENAGFGSCLPCPSHSVATDKASSSCTCESGFYRAPYDPQSSPCTKPPSKPQNVQVVSVDQTTVVVRWNVPEDYGGRPTVWYRVECSECPVQTQFWPSKTRFNGTKLTVKHLEPSTIYTLMIYAENDVSDLSDSLSANFVALDIKTKALSPWKVTNFKVDSAAENQVTLTWDPPQILIEYDSENTINLPRHPSDVGRRLFSLDNDSEKSSQHFVQYYQVRFHNEKETDYSKIYYNKTIAYEPKITLNNLLENTDYQFEVRPYTIKGYGAWSESKHVRTLASHDWTKSSINSSSSWAALIISIVCIIILLTTLYRCYQKGRMFKFLNHKRTSDLDTLEYKTDAPSLTPDYRSSTIYRRKLDQAFNNNPYKPYVDPTNYENPKDLLKDFANEIDPERIIIEEIIGVGEFGKVCKGQLLAVKCSTTSDNDQQRTVAIKTLKTGSSEEAKLGFLTEASIMGQFNHPNVIRLVGVVIKSEPVMILTEYMENRSLDSFLRLTDRTVHLLQLVQMLYGISQGMKYLNDKGYVHRDLAARNVLVDKQLVCKIADFGLSRGVTGSYEQIYTTKGGKIPVRWTAPEAIAYRKFTTSSDVWSFGIVMWEVMSFGERPYGDWTNQKVIQEVENGYRLEPPVNCPSVLHQLMLSCWNSERQYRPSFAAIVQTFQSFCNCPEMLYSPPTVCNELLLSQHYDSTSRLPSNCQIEGNNHPANYPATLCQSSSHSQQIYQPSCCQYAVGYCSSTMNHFNHPHHPHHHHHHQHNQSDAAHHVHNATNKYQLFSSSSSSIYYQPPPPLGARQNDGFFI